MVQEWAIKGHREIHVTGKMCEALPVQLQTLHTKQATLLLDRFYGLADFHTRLPGCFGELKQ